MTDGGITYINNNITVLELVYPRGILVLPYGRGFKYTFSTKYVLYIKVIDPVKESITIIEKTLKGV